MTSLPATGLPERRRPALTARWSNLALLTYDVDASLLGPWLAGDVEPDLVDGRALMSLIAFDFVDTRVRGRRIPGFVDFPEINFRTYVRQGDRRGVVAIRELVPSPLAAAIGRLRFNEPFRSAPMESRTASMGDELVVEHRWRWEQRRYFLRITADQASTGGAADAAAHNLLGRRWAYGRSRRGEPIVVRVEHPEWALRRVRTLDFDVDFGALYGPEWSVLNGRQPIATHLAVGSAVSIFPPGR
ncbi:MAG TPA: DUF2071 domain-containing protein [Gemmatimonadales bacterium]|nr:DUF2071 domain-containing protein [Gemmatimonadales bacterium]